MDEVGFSSVNSLSLGILHFQFKENGILSPDAYINAGGPGNLTYLDESVIEGTAAGVLDLQFSVPITHLSFGLALSTVEPIAKGASITALNAYGDVLSKSSIDFLPLISYSEAWFKQDFDGATEISIEFTEPALRFAMDTLSYTNAQASPIPEPSALGLLIGACSALLIAQMANQRRDT